MSNLLLIFPKFYICVATKTLVFSLLLRIRVHKSTLDTVSALLFVYTQFEKLGSYPYMENTELENSSKEKHVRIKRVKA